MNDFLWDRRRGGRAGASVCALGAPPGARACRGTCRLALRLTYAWRPSRATSAAAASCRPCRGDLVAWTALGDRGPSEAWGRVDSGCDRSACVTRSNKQRKKKKKKERRTYAKRNGGRNEALRSTPRCAVLASCAVRRAWRPGRPRACSRRSRHRQLGRGAPGSSWAAGASGGCVVSSSWSPIKKNRKKRTETTTTKSGQETGARPGEPGRERARDRGGAR